MQIANIAEAKIPIKEYTSISNVETRRGRRIISVRQQIAPKIKTGAPNSVSNKVILFHRTMFISRLACQVRQDAAVDINR